MDAAALERVYREEATRIRAALAARLGDVGLAEDAVQDAFVEAIEHWRDGQIPANCGGWLGTPPRPKATHRHRPPQAHRPAAPGPGRAGQAPAARRDHR